MKKLLLLMIIAIASQTQGLASVTVDQATSANYLRNQGFSEDTTNIVNVSKARSAGLEYYTPQEETYRNQNKFVRFWRNFFNYADPASEDYSFFHHDTTPTPTYRDL